MLLSKACDYGLRAAVYVAARGKGRYVPIAEVAEALGISFHFLTKTLQVLTQHQLLTSSRGPKGGVALARPAESITLRQVIEALDGSGLFERCVLGLDYCGDDDPCPLHDQWRAVRQQMVQLFGETTLASLAEAMEADGLRLTDRSR
ncbi:MAG: Rrf2 family transcriptional regulator [Nitrospirae bacterium]|nr:MAG: Rrf2 family transcriptional regulator [Nitrospirota bacterium]